MNCPRRPTPFSSHARRQYRAGESPSLPDRPWAAGPVQPRGSAAGRNFSIAVLARRLLYVARPPRPLVKSPTPPTREPLLRGRPPFKVCCRRRRVRGRRGSPGGGRDAPDLKTGVRGPVSNRRPPTPYAPGYIRCRCARASELRFTCVAGPRADAGDCDRLSLLSFAGSIFCLSPLSIVLLQLELHCSGDCSSAVLALL